MKTRFVAVVRLLKIAPHVVAGLYFIYGHFPKWSSEKRSRYVEYWAHGLIQRLSIQLVVKGEPPRAGPVLLVANHISWLDILVMHAARHCRFVSKADVKNWPVIGTLADASGTLFIERTSKRDALRMVDEMSQALKNGDILAVFPEGTTGNGIDLLPFHSNLLQAAVLAEAPVQPVAMKFVEAHSGEISHGPSFVGDETFLASLWRTLKSSGIVAVVNYGEVQSTSERDRRLITDVVRNDIERLRKLQHH